MSVGASSRLLALLSLLRQEQEWTGRALAARLGVETRTIRRDVQKLRALGYPVEAASGTAGGYRLGAAAPVAPLTLEDGEALAVAVGLRTAASNSVGGLEPTTARALAKIELALPERLQQRLRALGDPGATFHFDGSRVDVDHLAVLAACCRDHTAARFDYTTGDGRAGRRDVEPHAIVHSGRHWYLVAYDRARDGWRLFRVDRVDGGLEPYGPFEARPLPGAGDPVAFVEQALASTDDVRTREPGVVRFAAPASDATRQVPKRFAFVEPDGPDTCVVRSRGGWTRDFLAWVAATDLPITGMEPGDMVDEARAMAGRLTFPTLAASAEEQGAVDAPDGPGEPPVG